MKSVLALLCLAVLLSGCQFAKLQVSVDLYKEDPRAVLPMTPETAVRMVEDLERLRASAAQKTASRIELATSSWQIYSQTWIEAGLVQRDHSYISHQDRYDAYVKAAKDAEAQLQPHLNDAVSALTEYARAYSTAYDQALTQFRECERLLQSQSTDNGAGGAQSPCSAYELASKFAGRLDDEWIVRRLPVELRRRDAQVRATVSHATECYRGFAGPLSEPLVIDWGGLRARLYGGLEAGGSETRNLERTVIGLNGRLAALAASTGLVSSKRIERAIETRGDVRGLFDSMLKIAVELESLRENLPENSSAETALSGLVRNSSRFMELIDRLQDTGDPVWRIVTDPANEENWNTDLAPSEYYAQGNSSVVVVRHDPTRHKFHAAANNPLALIQGQLAISHALTKAAINIAGASSGIPVSALQQDEPEAAPATEPVAATTTNEAEAFAARKATVEEAERTRERALRGLTQELAGIQATLASASSDGKLVAAQKARIKSVLQAYKALFEIASE